MTEIDVSDTTSAAELAQRHAAITAELNALAIPDEAAEIVRKADEVLDAHDARVAGLLAKRNEIDRTFQVRSRARADENARQRQEHRAALCKEIVADERAFLDNIEKMEQALRAFVAEFTEALAANGRIRANANLLTGGASRLTALSSPDFVSRTGGRISGLMGAIKGHPARLGAVEWKGGSLYPPTQKWRDREEAVIAPAIGALIEPQGNG